MEIAVLWLLSMMAMGNEIEKTNDSLRMIESEVITLQIQQEVIFDTLEDHEATILKTAAAHSSLHARQRLDHDTHHEKIDLLTQQINALKEMSAGESSTTSSNVPDKP